MSEPGEVAEIAAAIARASLVAFDLEFVSRDRLVPVLCLLQLAWVHDASDAGKGAIRLVDPLAVDVAPIVGALAAHPVVVAHAARQDLGLLAARFGTGMAGLVDTQLMAAFCGIGDQVGLATLADEVLGVALGKEQQWTDWAARPLSPAQLAYAEADVRHLPAIYAALAPRLGGRLAWVRAESAQVVVEAVAAASVTPETAWQHVAGARGLDPAGHAAMVELAAWRQRVAVELDRPLGQVLADKLLVELARHRPNAAAVRQQKGLSPLARTRADAIAQAIARSGFAGPRSAAERRRGDEIATSGSRTKMSGLRTERSGTRTSPRAQRWADVLLALVQLVAEDTGIAPRLLATRADAEELARAVDDGGLAAAEPLPALASWRREVLGEVWKAWLSGQIALVGDPASPHGIRLVPRG